MNYHIALCGAGGTGKGTLMKTFFEMYKPESMLPIPSPVKPISTLIDPDAKSYKDFDRTGKMLMQYATLAAEINAERVVDNSGYGFMAERSVIDFLPYFAKCGFYGFEFRAYISFVVRYLLEHPYDLIVRVKAEFKPNDEDENAWKERDEKDRQETERYLDHWFEEHTFDIPVISVHGTPEERAQQIMDKLKEIKEAAA